MEMVYYQALASTIQGFISKGIRRLVITSSGPGEGKTTIAANLARALAKFGKENVVLVDTDQIRPSLHKIFGLKNDRGLGELLKEVYQVDVGNGNFNRCFDKQFDRLTVLSKVKGLSMVSKVEPFGLGDWVELLRVQAKSGRLVIAEDSQEFNILFRKGRISTIYWQQGPEDRRLGSLLVRSGRVTKDQIGAALQLQQETREPLGDTLCRLGYLEPADLESPLQSQHKGCLHRIFALREPSVLFFETQESDRESVIQNGDKDNGLTIGRFRTYLEQPFISGQIPGYLKNTEMKNLKVLTSGAIPYDLQDRAIAEQFKALLDRLARRYDVVLIDSPPVALASPATTLATLADGVLLVVKSDGLDVEIIRQAKEQLEKAGANVLGVILNQVNLKQDKLLSYYYGA